MNFIQRLRIKKKKDIQVFWGQGHGNITPLRRALANFVSFCGASKAKRHIVITLSIGMSVRLSCFGFAGTTCVLVLI